MRGSGFPSLTFRGKKNQVSEKNEKNRLGGPEGRSVEASSGVQESPVLRTGHSLGDAMQLPASAE